MLVVGSLTLLAASLSEKLWVAGGALLTVVLGVVLLYWIDQEWLTRDRRAAHHGASEAPPPTLPPAEDGDEPPTT